MDDDNDSGLDLRNWGYYDPPLDNLGLQLMTSMVECDTKPLLLQGTYLHMHCSALDTAPLDFERDDWNLDNRERNKILNLQVGNHHDNSNYDTLYSTSVPHAFQMIQNPQPPKNETVLMIDNPTIGNENPLRKKLSGCAQRTSKPKKAKKVAPEKDETIDATISCEKGSKRNMGMVINGVIIDISGIAAPVCSCTGKPQQCYRWGAGGWQSACCTTSISMYPLPMSTKRKGARIPGRKMSQGAFKKVLERLMVEGYNLSDPIDLRPYWAKHGTNKFVTIR